MARSPGRHPRLAAHSTWNLAVLLGALALLAATATARPRTAWAQAPEVLAEGAPEGGRPRVGLALSGGGARALAEIGVLRALVEQGVPIDCVTGNSMGAILGGLYAAGVSPDSLAKLAARPALFSAPNTYSGWSVFQKEITRPQAFALQMTGFEYRLPRALVNDVDVNWLLLSHATPASLLARGDFDRLPTPFRAVALDLSTGQTVTLGEGDLARAIRSSMSVPITFPPIRTQSPERTLIDAGVCSNLPIQPLVDMHADFVIAVNCTERWDGQARVDDLTDVATRLVDILSARVDSVCVEGWDVWIEPEVKDIGTGDYERAAEAIEAGYRAAVRKVPQIRALLDERRPLRADAHGDADPLFTQDRPASAADVAPARPTVRELSARTSKLEVAWVRLEGRRLAYSWVPRTELGLEPGQRFELEALGRGLRRLQGTNLYESVWPRLELVSDDQIGVTLELEERTPTSVGLGLLYDNNRLLNVNLEISRSNLLRLGESIYLDLALGNFRDGVEAGIRSGRVRGLPLAFDIAGITRRTRYLREDSGDFVWRERGVEVSTGLVGGHQALLWGGARIAESRGEAVGGRLAAGEGGSDLPFDWEATNRSVFVRGVVDDSDQRVLPSRGLRGRAQWELFFDPAIEATHHVLSAEFSSAVPVGRGAIEPAFSVAGSGEGSGAFRFLHRLDLTRASLGRFEPDLYAKWAASAGTTLSFRLAPKFLVYSSTRAGFWAVTADELEKSPARWGTELGVLQRTPIGPLLLGLAAEEERGPSLFVQIGNDVVGDR